MKKEEEEGKRTPSRGSLRHYKKAIYKEDDQEY
jgi:hypothetical protein